MTKLDEIIENWAKKQIKPISLYYKYLDKELCKKELRRYFDNFINKNMSIFCRELPHYISSNLSKPKFVKKFTNRWNQIFYLGTNVNDKKKNVSDDLIIYVLLKTPSLKSYLKKYNFNKNNDNAEIFLSKYKNYWIPIGIDVWMKPLSIKNNNYNKEVNILIENINNWMCDNTSFKNIIDDVYNNRNNVNIVEIFKKSWIQNKPCLVYYDDDSLLEHSQIFIKNILKSKLPNIISKQNIEINNNYYTRQTNNISNDIKLELDDILMKWSREQTIKTETYFKLNKSKTEEMFI